MPKYPRRVGTRVKDGKVQRKNRWAETPTYYNTPQDVPQIVRERPGPGYRHVLKKRDLVDFISILPDWEELSKGLNAVLLAPGDDGADGWHDSGVVAICAWPRELWVTNAEWYYQEHVHLFRRLGVPCERSNGEYECRFTESTVRAYLLLHIFLHELGHHHDRMTTRSKREPSRGEDFAEYYALLHEAVVWERYLEVFGL